MMLHMNPEIRRIAKGHAQASGKVDEIFRKSIDENPLILRGRPALSGVKDLGREESRVIRRISRRVGGLAPGEINSIMGFAQNVAKHLRDIRFENGRDSHRLMLGIPSNGHLGVATYQLSQADRFIGRVDRLVSPYYRQLAKVRALERIKLMRPGSPIPGHLLKQVVSGEIHSGSVLEDGRFRSDFTFAGIRTKGEFDAGAMLLKVKPKVTSDIARAIFYLGRGMHPNYKVSYLLDSLAAVRPRVPRIPRRIEDTRRFFASIAENSKYQSPFATRLLTFLGSSPAHLNDLLEIVEKHPLPEGLPSKQRLGAELDIVKRVRQNKPEAVRELVVLVESHPVPDIAFLTIRMEPGFRKRLANFIRNKKINAPKTQAGLQIADSFYGTASETAENLYGAIKTLWENLGKQS
ncbi:MAG: hypothetical protein ABH863_06130 [Candidatus Micrarchaeota archaeon]